jgi:hypothetical protein
MESGGSPDHRRTALLASLVPMLFATLRFALLASVLASVLASLLAVFCRANLVPFLVARLASGAPETARSCDCKGGREHDASDMLVLVVLCARSVPVALIRVSHEAYLYTTSVVQFPLCAGRTATDLTRHHRNAGQRSVLGAT